MGENTIKTLFFIQEYIRRNSFPPTGQEIANHMGFSKTAAYHHTEKLHAAGMITSEYDSPRSIRLTQLGETWEFGR